MRVSIITGGGSGIGAAVARRLAAKDGCLMLHGQGADEAGLARLKAVAAECERAGAKVEVRTGDLAKAGSASELVSATRASFGAIDAIVHAAGFADRRGFAKLPRDFAAGNRTSSSHFLVFALEVIGRRKGSRFRFGGTQKFIRRIFPDKASLGQKRDSRAQKNRFPHVMRDEHN